MVKAPGPAREAVGWSERRPRSCLLAVGGRAVIFDVGKEERGLNGASLFDIQAVTVIRTVFCGAYSGKNGPYAETVEAICEGDKTAYRISIEPYCIDYLKVEKNVKVYWRFMPLLVTKY